MKPILKAALLAAMAGALAAISASPGRAAEDPSKYPSQPIRMIVPFAPGGASDFAARLLQPHLSAALGQQVVVENRAGAAGNVGMDVAARAAPDGYTLFLGNVGTVSINPSMFADLTVKPQKDFIPVTIVADTPGVMIAHPGFPPNSAKEMVEHVKKNPGKVNFASPGSGSLNRLEMETFALNNGLQMTHIPYKGGAGPAVADVMGGHVEVMFSTISSAMNHIKEGRLKALGVTTKERVPGLPNVPTLVEQGFPANVSSSWQGILVPTGTPKPIVDKIFAATVKAMAVPEIKSRMEEAGTIAAVSKSPEDFAAYIQADAAKWTEVIKVTGAKPE
jgi:tripartite-type tricarboxylate transporter receptor subunit TctC